MCGQGEAAATGPCLRAREQRRVEQSGSADTPPFLLPRQQRDVNSQLSSFPEPSHRKTLCSLPVRYSAGRRERGRPFSQTLGHSLDSTVPPQRPDGANDGSGVKRTTGNRQLRHRGHYTPESLASRPGTLLLGGLCSPVNGTTDPRPQLPTDSPTSFRVLGEAAAGLGSRPGGTRGSCQPTGRAVPPHSPHTPALGLGALSAAPRAPQPDRSKPVRPDLRHPVCEPPPTHRSLAQVEPKRVTAASPALRGAAKSPAVAQPSPPRRGDTRALRELLPSRWDHGCHSSPRHGVTRSSTKPEVMLASRFSAQ